MKLVLMSFANTEVITQKIIELAGKPANEIKIAIINEATLPVLEESGAAGWILDSFASLREHFTNEIYMCNFLSLSLEENVKRINKADVIWVLGGNTDYLKLVFEKSGFEKYLPEMLETKVWVGSSAGSCILGKRGNEEFFALYEEKPYAEVKEYYGFVNGIIYPHTEWFTNAFDICTKESKANRNVAIYSLSDKSALIVEDGKTYLIGENAQKFVNGEVVEKI
ncbi:MAG: Type 1 glutamine amidotransferase-like domain-containing protein [Spirochaetaceae bacterium]|nr:Type 1 glutamine amidotransferase-like domain-containing protein [Spirochaetaceae bacterium]